jgi:hypothetical protein
LSKVYEITGNPFGFFSSIKSGGTGSPSITITDAPSEGLKIVNQNAGKKFCNIWILQKEIILRFKSCTVS